VTAGVGWSAYCGRFLADCSTWGSAAGLALTDI
jgi:hypothetical protein